MEVHDIESVVHEKTTERCHPPDIEVAPGSESVHDDALRFDGRGQRVLRVEDEGHFVVEDGMVTARDQVDQELLGTSVTQALGHQ
jgi:hypothetical protein